MQLRPSWAGRWKRLPKPAIKQVHDYLASLSDEEFFRLLDEHANGDFAVMLRETGTITRPIEVKAEAEPLSYCEACDKSMATHSPFCPRCGGSLEDAVEAKAGADTRPVIFEQPEGIWRPDTDHA